MPTPLTDADKVIRNDTGISIANAITALSGVVRGGNENIGDAYNSSNLYAAGDYCIYENTLYKCTGATSGAWDSTKWTATSIADEINELNSGKADSANFDGCEFKVVPINSNSTFNTPTYTEICTAIIGRGQAGMFVASNNGVVAIFDNQLIRTARVPSGNTQYMSIQNNSSATIIALVIYK